MLKNFNETYAFSPKEEMSGRKRKDRIVLPNESESVKEKEKQKKR